MTDKDAKAFAESLKENRTLTYLDLSHNEIGEMGGIYLGAGLVSTVVSKGHRFYHFFFFFTCDLVATYLRLTYEFLATYLRLATCEFLAIYLRLVTYWRLSCDLFVTYLRLSCPVTQLSHLSQAALLRNVNNMYSQEEEPEVGLDHITLMLASCTSLPSEYSFQCLSDIPIPCTLTRNNAISGAVSPRLK